MTRPPRAARAGGRPRPTRRPPVAPAATAARVTGPGTIAARWRSAVVRTRSRAASGRMAASNATPDASHQAGRSKSAGRHAASGRPGRVPMRSTRYVRGTRRWAATRYQVPALSTRPSGSSRRAAGRRAPYVTSSRVPSHTARATVARAGPGRVSWNQPGASSRNRSATRPRSPRAAAGSAECSLDRAAVSTAPRPRSAAPAWPRVRATVSDAVKPSTGERHPSTSRMPPPVPASVHRGTPAACSIDTSR